jgi:hypothetical protein
MFLLYLSFGELAAEGPGDFLPFFTFRTYGIAAGVFFFTSLVEALSETSSQSTDV